MSLAGARVKSGVSFDKSPLFVHDACSEWGDGPGRAADFDG